jgi:hypothetical protein
MVLATCFRCKGNIFLEQLGREEAAWVCLQCGSQRYVRPDDPWPFALEGSSHRAIKLEGVLR